MRKRVSAIFKYLLFLGAGIFLVWWQLKDMSADEQRDFASAFKSANYWLIVPIVFMSLFSHLFRAIRWKYLMEPLGYKPSLKNVFSVVMVGYLANSAIPRLGEILKCTFLARYEKLKVDKLVGTIIVERTFDLLCFVIFIGLTVIIQIDVIGIYIKDKIIAISSGSGLPIWVYLLISASALLILLAGIKLLLRKFPENKLIQRIKNIIKGIFEGFKTIVKLKKKKLFLLMTLLIWALYLLQIYIGFRAMEGTAHLDIKAAFSVLTLATLAMIASPGGIGWFPFFVMETLLIYGIASPLGNALGWLIWGVSTGIVIVTGVACLLFLPYINRKKDEIRQQHT
ncbi:MAG: lysylphosphatidylglycerol synthase transmembrane domain-containing protein [Ferruginibacter sp.]